MSATQGENRAGDQKAASSSNQASGQGESQKAQKARKWYPLDDELNHKRKYKVIRPAKLRPSLTPGTVLIVLAGKYAGKRVVLLKHLSQGILLVTGPFKVNNVPLRRFNARYVIATSAKVDLATIDKTTMERVTSEGYLSQKKDKKSTKGEEEFFAQGEKRQKRKIPAQLIEDQKTIDKALISTIKKEPSMIHYLGSSFSLRKGDRPHEMKW
ncbi:MAG: hypothetical protein M1826_005400 [Phylliscum demangeonii]|nr:MAG: hypothetical protein M1826_005400 [Phylliscum demangeonii]